MQRVRMDGMLATAAVAVLVLWTGVSRGLARQDAPNKEAQKANPLAPLAVRCGHWLSTEPMSLGDGREQWILFDTKYDLGDSILRTKQFVKEGEGTWKQDVEEIVFWDPKKKRFVVQILSTEGWLAYAEFTAPSDTTHQLDCEVIFANGQSMNVRDYFEFVNSDEMLWTGYIVRDGVQGEEPYFKPMHMVRKASLPDDFPRDKG